jgi:uncharacterized protein (DUF1015 family)
MLRVSPFHALRPDTSLAARVASVPYDVVNIEEARQLAEGNPLSFLHVVRPEIDLPEDTNPYDDAVYAKARENLDRLVADNVLQRDDAPAIYLYRQVMDHRPQVGIVCCCHIDDYANDLIKKHERTRQVKEDDRTRHVKTLNANTGPVFLTYRQVQDIDALVESDMNDRPLYHFNAPDGVTHTVWAVKDPPAYVQAFAAHVPCAYVADGHHRSASAARAGAERRDANPNHTGTEEYNWFLTVLFPDNQLHILPYNRVVIDLNGMSVDEVKQRLAEVGTLTATDNPSPEKPGVFCFHLDGAWLRLELDPASIDHHDPIESLDVALLQQRVLSPIFGIDDPRTDDRIDFVGGIRGTGELEKRVRDGWAVGISMHATTIDQLLAVADAGLIMPPKSTWFEPKLRSGLFVHSLD